MSIPSSPGKMRPRVYSEEQMHAALDINLPNYASAILTADVVVESIASLCGTKV